MKNEKEEVQRKLNIAKERLSVVNTELTRLDSLLAPLKKQLADAEQTEKSLQARIEKLTGILARF